MSAYKHAETWETCVELSPYKDNTEFIYVCVCV